jgi:hypothetical protein
MAVAAPRRSGLQTAPAPSRTAPPPEPKKRPRDRPRPGGNGRSSAAAPAKAPTRKPAAPKRKAAPGRKKASARAATAAPARKKASSARAGTARAATAAATAPARAPRRKVAPKRRTGARVIPIAAGTAGRAAVAVTQLPESGLIHRLTRGRAWIGVLGVLLVGIVALNVVTLSFAASAGKIDEKITELSKENSMLQSRQAEHYGQARIRHEAGKLGLAPSTQVESQLIYSRQGDVAEAASRLAAASAANPE